jgi:hypothetical protein
MIKADQKNIRKRNNGISITSPFQKSNKDNIPITKKDNDKKLDLNLTTLENSEISSVTSDGMTPPPPLHQILEPEKKRNSKNQFNIVSDNIVSCSSSEGDFTLVIPPQYPQQQQQQQQLRKQQQPPPPTTPIKTENQMSTTGHQHRPNIIYTYKDVLHPSPIQTPHQSYKFIHHRAYSPLRNSTSFFNTNSKSPYHDNGDNHNNSNNNYNSTNAKILFKNEKMEQEIINSSPSPSISKTNNAATAFSNIEIIENEKKLDSILCTLQDDHRFSNVLKKEEKKKTKTKTKQNKTKQNKQTKKILHKKIMIIEPEVSGTQTLTKSYDEK